MDKPKTVDERVRAVIARVAGREVTSVHPESNIHTDFELDSLDKVEVLMGVEDEFGIEITDQEAESFKKVSDIVVHVAKVTNL